MKTVFKKSYWTEKNKGFEIVTDININIILNLKELEKKINESKHKSPGSREITNNDEIVNNLLMQVFRVNDLKTIKHEEIDPNHSHTYAPDVKNLKIIEHNVAYKTDWKQHSRYEVKEDDCKVPLRLNDSNDSKLWDFLHEKLVNKQKLKSEEEGNVLGFSSKISTILPDILFDCNSNMKDYPYNFNDIQVKIELEPKKIEVKCKIKDENGEQVKDENNEDEEEIFIVDFA